MASEFVSPIAVDLRAEDNKMDIIKGMTVVDAHVKDEVLDATLRASGVEAGDWLVLGPLNTLVAPGVSPVANTYPVWVGYDQYDSQATGQCTIIPSGGFIYRTTKYVAGSYTNGQNLTVKDPTSAGVRIPSAASGSDPILARVYKAPDSKGVMEIQVLDR